MKKSLGIIFALVTLFSVVPNALALTKAFQVNTASGGTLTTGLVSYYNMQGNSNDYYGSNNGTDTSVTYGTSYGKVAQGANFSGSGLINLGNTLNIVGAISISAWVYANATGQKGIIGRGNGTNGDHTQFVLDIDSSNNARFYIRQDGSSGTYFIAQKAMTQNAWHHVVGTWAGVGSPLNIYVDNVLGTPSSNFSGTQGIGSVTHIGNDGNGGANWSAYIDELGIWSKALSTQEISDLYNGGAGQTMCNGTGGPLCAAGRRHQIVLNPFEAKFEHFNYV